MLIWRRHATESQLLEDLVEWITHAEVGPNEERFSWYATVRGKMPFKRLWPRQMREEVKAICDAASLDPKFFSAHLLRKGFQTHMSVLGALLDDRRERGNYSASSQVPATTYDYSGTGHRAWSSSSLGKGSDSDIETHSATGTPRQYGGRWDPVDPCVGCSRLRYTRHNPFGGLTLVWASPFGGRGASQSLCTYVHPL